MKSTDYWKADVGTQGQLVSVGKYDSLTAVIDAAKRAGIPRKHWDKVIQETDYSGCYYENDEPSIKWVFPLTVFDK